MKREPENHTGQFNNLQKSRRKEKELEKLTLERFKDCFSCIPIYNIAKYGERYKLTSKQMFFRSFSDLVAEKVWNDENTLYPVLNHWHHCFPKDYEITK